MQDFRMGLFICAHTLNTFSPIFEVLGKFGTEPDFLISPMMLYLSCLHLFVEIVSKYSNPIVIQATIIVYGDTFHILHSVVPQDLWHMPTIVVGGK